MARHARDKPSEKISGIKCLTMIFIPLFKNNVTLLHHICHMTTLIVYEIHLHSKNIHS